MSSPTIAARSAGTPSIPSAASKNAGAGFPQIAALHARRLLEPHENAPPSSSSPPLVRQYRLRCMPTRAAPSITSRKTRFSAR